MPNNYTSFLTLSQGHFATKISHFATVMLAAHFFPAKRRFLAIFGHIACGMPADSDVIGILRRDATDQTQHQNKRN
jgi:hypothetical protein